MSSEVYNKPYSSFSVELSCGYDLKEFDNKNGFFFQLINNATATYNTNSTTSITCRLLWQQVAQQHKFLIVRLLF